MRIKSILFDMDGVLIDAKDWHYEALNEALSLFGMEISRYDHLVTYDGLPTKKKLEMLSQERGLPKELHEFINEIKQEATFQFGYMQCRPNFNHQYALSKLKQQNYRMAVCSNSIRKTMDIFLERAKINSYFEFYLSSQDVKKPKPDPEIYIKAMKKMNILPEECLILEDNENGIKAAKSSGANVMIVNTVNDVTYQNIKDYIVKVEQG